MEKWYFIHTTDLHLSQTTDGVWNNRILSSQSFEIFQCFLADIQKLNPDFIVISGDICSCDDETLSRNAQNLFETIKVPLYLTGGNHDLSTTGRRKFLLKFFKNYLPRSSFTYSFVHKGILFCVLEISWLWHDGTVHPIMEQSPPTDWDDHHNGIRWVIAPKHLRWLQRQSKMAPDLPLILITHCPLLPIPKRCQFDGYQDSGILTNANEVLQILEKHPKRCVVFSGHMHMNYIEEHRHITQVVTSSLCEYPNEYRIVAVEYNVLKIVTSELSNPIYAYRSLIPGREKTRGTTIDRVTAIPLN